MGGHLIGKVYGETELAMKFNRNNVIDFDCQILFIAIQYCFALPYTTLHCTALHWHARLNTLLRTTQHHTQTATNNNDKVLASKLCEELNSLSTLRFDPTNPENTITSQEFDVEEWYYQARIRVYGIIAA